MYTFTCYVCIDPELELMGDRQVMDRILDVVGQCDGYRYILRNEADPEQSFDISFTGYCSRSLTYQQNNPDRERVRQHERMPVYDCHGRIQGIIKRQLGYVELEVRHESHPPADAVERLRYQQLERNIVPQEIREAISRSSQLTNAASVYRRIIREFPDSNISPMQVYYWWTRTFEREYRLHPDQLLSARMLVQRYNNQGFYEVRNKRRATNTRLIFFLLEKLVAVCSCDISNS